MGSKIKRQMDTIKELGLDTKNGNYVDSVENLIEYIKLLQEEIEHNNKDLLEQEIIRVFKPTN